ncbi:MAG: translation elongation factor Ts [Thermodesulfobacteriota bacterium]
MEISAKTVKELRDKTDAGFMDCKKALKETNGDVEKAVVFLREKGLSAASKKAGRVTSEGVVYSYIHPGGKLGVLLEVNCETDFVARNEAFLALVKDIAMHIAAMGPAYLNRSEVTPEVIEAEKAIYTNQAKESGKPLKVVEKIVEGKLDKFLKGICLLEQPFVKDPERTIEQLIVENVARIGENISVRRFVRFKVGEGMEKKEDDFLKEVAALQG